MARTLTSGIKTYTARETQSIGLLDFVIDTLVLCSLKFFLNLRVGILVTSFVARFQNIFCIPVRFLLQTLCFVMVILMTWKSILNPYHLMFYNYNFTYKKQLTLFSYEDAKKEKSLDMLYVHTHIYMYICVCTYNR